MKKTFFTIMDVENVHLIKDVGLIPYGMFKYCDYDSYIVTYNHGGYLYLQDRVKGLKLIFIKKHLPKFDLDAFFYILRNAKNIDVLNCYHMRSTTGLLVVLYKILNKNGKVYLKLDGGVSSEGMSLFHKAIFRYMFKRCDLISAETVDRLQVVQDSWRVKVENIPNPFNLEDLKDFKRYSLRKNQILTVGRIGTSQKATEILLKAWEIVARVKKDWELILVGPIEKEECNFSEYIEKWHKENADIFNRTKFVGNINDREELIKIYTESKIFAFPSRHESFGIAALEAIICGTYIVGSNISTTKNLTDNFKFASSFEVDDYNGLARQLLSSIDNECEVEIKAKCIYEQSIDKYSLDNISRKIDSLL